MSIKEVTYYVVACDTDDCERTPHDDGDYTAWGQVDGALDDLANAYDWYASKDDRHLCPDHAPTCLAEGCVVRLDSDEWGSMCEDHGEDGGT